MNRTRGSTPPNSTPGLSIHSTDSNKTLGTVGTPHGHSIAKLWSPKLVELKGIEGFLPRTKQTLGQRKPPNRASLLTDLGGESKGKEPQKGSRIYLPPNPKEKGLEITPRKSPRKGSENHQKGKSGRTQISLEEPHRIIYTYHEGSYKV
jgi:hypothetical protein